MTIIESTFQEELFAATGGEEIFVGAQKSQLELLSRCIQQGLDLHSELEAAGLTYDDLRYRTPEPVSQHTDRYYEVADLQAPSNDVPMVSFFSGCGGLDLGFEAAGFHHAALVEHNEIFCKSLHMNRPEWRIIGPPEEAGDVSDQEAITDSLRQILGRRKRFDGIFVGGPPCQPFSIAANQRFNKSGENFKRTGFDHEVNGSLLFDYINLIVEFQPRAFLIENVTGLMEIDGGKQLSKACSLLSEAGYTVEAPLVLDAKNYLVPQQRRRLFIAGARTRDQFVPPTASRLPVNCWRAFEKPLLGVENHVTRKHRAESIVRYMALRVGERDQLGRVDRLDPNKPSKTVIAGGTRGGGRSHLHPFIPRTLSVRESARLQTFPDDYVFSGSHARQFTQVGNAVPPVLAVQLAKSLAESYFG